jgi:hypothetical protein
MEDFEREELQDIRDKAVISAEGVPNNHWQRAYKQLADAADKLDAMMARCEDRN